MKKTALILSLFLLVGTGRVFADAVEESLPTQETSVVEQEQTTDTQIIEEAEVNKSQSLEENSEKTVETPQNVKNGVEKEIMFLNAYLQRGYITQEEYSTYVDQLNAAKTEAEVKQITDKIYESNQNVINYRWAFSERYINLKNNVTIYQKNGTLTKEQAEKLLNKLENATTLEEIQTVEDELNAILNEEERPVTDSELFYAQLRLDVLFANNFLKQDQYEQLSKELKLVKTNQDLARFYYSVELSTTPESITFMNAYVEKYYGIQANITASVTNGSITKEQGDKLHEQLNAARTNEELDAVSKELDKLLNGKTEPTTEPTTQPTTDKKEPGKIGTLPKTGEVTSSKLITLGGILLLGIGGGYLIFKKK